MKKTIIFKMRKTVITLHNYLCSTLGNVHYTGKISWVQWGEIPWVHQGMFSTLGGYHEYSGGYCEYTGRVSWVHWGFTMMSVGDIMNTLGGILSTSEDLGMNGERQLPNFQDFCSSTFCDYTVLYVGLWNIRQLVKIPLSGRQSPEPNTFLFSSLIKSL